MAFGSDGMLYLALGDGAAFHVRDYGQLGGLLPDPSNPTTPVNPCGDPATVTSAPGDAPVVDPATGEGGSLRSQDVRTTGDPTGLAGALIRVDPDTGAAAPGNPLAASADPNAARIVAHGFRNPFRLAQRPGTDELYIGDVGNNNWEEIERFVPGSGGTTETTLPNFGWPCYEGDGPTDSWPELENGVCDDLYAEGPAAVLAPLYAYSHHTADGPCGIAGTLTASVTGLAFYDRSAAGPGPFPARYDGALFLADYSRDCLAVLLPDGDGIPDPATMEVVGTGLSNPVDLVTGPNGDLYYPDLHGGVVMRIRYAEEPVAAATATPDVSLAPVSVTLDASASLDPDPEGVLVAWRWDLDHDGTFDGPGDASGEVVEWAITTPGIYPVTLEVESSLGLTDRLELVVDASDAPPVPRIDLPRPDLAWSVGEAVAFGGSATDAEDGTIPASGLDWSVGLLHCGPSDCHEHVLQDFDGVAGDEVIAPDHPYPSRMVLHLDATDSHGTTRSTVLELDAMPATLTVNSIPTGVPITVGDETAATPTSTTLIRGGILSLSAPATHTVGATTYRFGSWSDGSTARSRDVTVGATQTLTATYVPDAPDTCGSAATIAKGTWKPQHTTGPDDEDWYAFSITARQRVIVTLGDLPLDARLELYGACDTLLAASDAGGTRFEELARILPAGTFRVRVWAPSGAVAATPWVLRVRALSARVAVGSARAVRSSGTVTISGEVRNATGTVTGRARVIARLLDAKGRVVARLEGTTFASRLVDGAVTPFVIRGRGPAFASVTFKVVEGAPRSGRVLVLRGFTVTPKANGKVVETGWVRNEGSLRAPAVAVARTWYDDRGEVVAVRIAPSIPARIEPGRRGAFTIVRPSLRGAQAAATSIRAR